MFSLFVKRVFVVCKAFSSSFFCNTFSFFCRSADCVTNTFLHVFYGVFCGFNTLDVRVCLIISALFQLLIFAWISD